MRWFLVFTCLLFSGAMTFSEQSGGQYAQATQTVDGFAFSGNAFYNHEVGAQNKEGDTTYFRRTNSHRIIASSKRFFGGPSIFQNSIDWLIVNFNYSKTKSYTPINGVFLSFLKCLIFPKHSFW